MRRTAAPVRRSPTRSAVKACCFIDNEPSIPPQIKAGKPRALAAARPSRSKAWPDGLKMHEAGGPDFVVEPWFGCLMPQGTPQPVIDQLRSACDQAIADPHTRRPLPERGLRGVGGPPRA